MLKNKKTLWMVIVVALVLIGGGYLVYTTWLAPSAETEAAETPEVQTAVAHRGDMVIYASGAGSVIPATEIGLGFSSSGTLSEMLVNVGDEVQTGQVLARLQTNNTEASIASSVTSAELSVLEAQQALADIYSNWELDAAQALLTVEETEQELESLLDPTLRQAEALQAIAAAEETLESAQVAYNRTQLTASQANIDALYAEMLLSKQSLERAEDNFDRFIDKPEDNVQRAQAQSKLSSAQDDYANAEANYNAATSAADKSEQALAAADLTVAEAELVAAQQDWERIKDAPEPEEINLAEIKLANAEAKLAVAQEEQVYVDLVTPMDGTILSIDAVVGEALGTSAIITLADLSTPLLEVYLDETDMDKVAVGFEVEIIFDAIPDTTFIGKVIQVDPSLETVQNVQVVRALVQLDDFAKPQTLPVGLNASVDVIGGRAENAVLVPVEALQELGPDEYAVFVMENDEPRLRVVTVGLVDFTSAEILSGLDAGEVVTTGIVETE
jgi:HlyD family secretion protein